MKKETIKQYPIVRYLCLLLVVALLFARVTFSRYQSRFTSENSVGIAEFDASYTIDNISTSVFGNAYFWQWYTGAWMDQGSGTASSVRITVNSNSAVDVRPTIRLEGPAEFWENIAIEIMDTAYDSATAGSALIPQLVMADLVRERGVGESHDEAPNETHRYTYGDYRNWGTGGTLETTTSDDFGQVGSMESSLTMSGSISATSGGAVTAEWKDGTGADSETWRMTITADMRDVDFSLGFTRQDQQTNAALPALYLDCTANVLYYTIELELPLELTPEHKSDTYVLFFNWTNAIQAKSLGVRFPTGDSTEEDTGFDVPWNFWKTLSGEGAQQTTITANGTKFTILGYHFNYTDVRYSTSPGGATADNTTTVRLIRDFASGLSYQHIARLNEDDGVFPHDMILEQGYYHCSRENRAYFAEDAISALSTNFNPATLKTKSGEGGDTGNTGTASTADRYVGASEKGYSTRISVTFVQASVLPSTSVTQ